MAYTYQDFEKQAQETGMYDKFSDADLKLARSNPNAGMGILSAKREWADAKTPEARALANRHAEDIRSSYGGYTGGTSGSYFTVNPLSPVQYQDSEREQATQKQMDLALQRMQANYNPQIDPVFTAYRQQHLREGQRATQDTMAAAAAMTGGIPSSHAVTAAAQQGNYYAGQVADKIPELAQQRFNQNLQQYNALQSRYETDRNFAYGQLNDEVQNQRYLRQEASQARQVQWEQALQAYQMGDASKLKEFGIDTSKDINRQIQELQLEQQKQTMQTQQWQDQLAKAQAAAQYGDYSLLKAMGFDITRANFANDLAVAQIIAQTTGDVSALQRLLTGNAGATASSGSASGSSGGSSGRSYSGGGSGSGSGSGGGGNGGSSLTAAQIAASRNNYAGATTVDYNAVGGQPVGGFTPNLPIDPSIPSYEQYDPAYAGWEGFYLGG